MVEATAVSPEGRITPSCTGLWNDAQAAAFAPIAAEVKASGAVPGIQIGHAGPKASSNPPWIGGSVAETDPLGWIPIGPMAKPRSAEANAVRAMSSADIARVQADFVVASKRAADAGFECLELHFGHGYLGQSFFSVWENQRDDDYGGTFDNRARFLVETVERVRAVWPSALPLVVRLGVTEFDGREEALEETIELVRRLKAAGVDLIDATVGFTAPNASIPWGPAFMATIAEKIGRAAEIPVVASWFITEPSQADALIREGQLDLVCVGRAMLDNPHWPFRAARELGLERPASATMPVNYAYWLDRYKLG